MSVKRILEVAAVSATVGGVAILYWLERRRPLRRAVESKLRRTIRNIGAGGLAAVALMLAERPVANNLTRYVERRRIGLLKLVRLPRVLETVIAVVLMDYTLYLWHVLTHKVPALWRLHLPHHVDLDLDASTAIRFHFTELVVAVLWRAGQIIVIGINPVSYAAWQLFLLPSILFHHSNVELSPRTDAWLRPFIVTPRMHGIHHSTVEDETNSNWSSGLTIWDRIHGTFRDDIRQEEITIGVPAYPEKVSLSQYVVMPFEPQRPTWQLPESTSPTQIDT
jgi:sterol desaturase/sphingolipid hydroxylase (fatty acid hydroxylase superfamily)